MMLMIIMGLVLGVIVMVMLMVMVMVMVMLLPHDMLVSFLDQLGEGSHVCP